MKQLFLFFAFLLPFCLQAQLDEPFNNPDITYKYPWKGDTERFVSENGFLRLNMARLGKSQVFLYGATLTENEWNFRVKSGHKTTSGNFIRLYLWCDKTNLDDLQFPKAYYIELGNNSTISFNTMVGYMTPEKLISKKITDLGDAFDLYIRVVADSKQITLYVRSAAKSDYIRIGSTDYTPKDKPGYFILYCNHTPTHAKNKYFGPITIKNFSPAIPPDPAEEKPAGLAFLSMEQKNDSTLILSFDQEVNPEHATFTLSPLGDASKVAYWSEDRKAIELVWEDTMIKGLSYTLLYKDLYDNENTAFTDFLPSFIATIGTTQPEIVIPATPKYSVGDIIISEVMANPKGAPGLPETEYIELHNTTDKSIDLTGWAFIYADKSTLLKSTIPAKGYAVLFRDGREIKVDHGGISIPLTTFPSALVNTGKQLSLKTKEGNVIDNIAYPSAKAGFSWERTGTTWQYSFDKRGGTPGSANSNESSGTDNEEEDDIVIPIPREIVFSELLPDPQTGGSEYIELYNRSDRTLPVSGLAIAIRKNDGSLNTNYSLNSITEPFHPGEYLLLTKNKDGVRDFFLTSVPESIHELKLPVLANTSSKLVLFRSQDKEVIDEVHYNENWHSPPVKNKKGVSLERIDPDGDSQSSENWTSASSLSGGGTPGYANSQSGTNPGDIPTGIHSPEYIATTGEYEIAYRLDRSGYFCRANIYDTSGRKVAEIANHELLGTEGIFSWSGTAIGGNKIATGVYIFHAELYHPQGGQKIYKKVFLVR